MKKLIVFLILVVAGYFVYDNFLKEESVLQVKGNLIKIRESANIDAPAVQPKTWGHIEGTVKNLSDKEVNNIEIIYKINGKESKTKVSKLAAGEEVKFKTNQIMLGSYEVSHFLEKVSFSD